jgi:hypothetical protein
MNASYRGSRWAAVLFAVAIALVVGFGAYNIGLSHGLARSAQIAVAPAIAPGTAPVFVYPYGWHRPWGFGFLFPLVFFGFWFLVLRGFFWRGLWRRGCWGYAGFDPSMRFDEWHRRAHERLKSEPPPPVSM